MILLFSFRYKVDLISIRHFKNNLLKDVIRYLNHTVLFIFFIIHDGFKSQRNNPSHFTLPFFYPDYQTSKTYFFFIYVCLTVCPSSIVWIFRRYIVTVSNQIFRFGNYNFQYMQYLFRWSHICLFLFYTYKSSLLRSHKIHAWHFSW